MEKGPVQPEALSELVAAFGQCHQLQTALSQKQTALQEQGIALQAAMQELQLQLLPRPQPQQQPMTLEESALQMAMQSALQQAVPLQQVGEEEELGSTSPCWGCRQCGPRVTVQIVAMLVWPAAALLLTVAVLLQPVALLL